MSALPFALFAWVIHALVAGLVVTPMVVLARKRVRWRGWELLSLVLPFSVWMGLMISDFSTGSKTLSNFVLEPGILALGLAGGALVRIALTKASKSGAPILVLIGLCLAGAAVFWIVPPLPE